MRKNRRKTDDRHFAPGSRFQCVVGGLPNRSSVLGAVSRLPSDPEVFGAP